MKNLEIGIEQAMFESKKDDWNIKILPLPLSTDYQPTLPSSQP